ncbi:CPBP family glutamic-type intramembrane protease [Entomospira nematocerorum]|uniref:CPBP family intramembrane metalloprotease n=1 Tax=Entomospira nematocerorum TaxID=2719987 RepID=A0A968GCL1_9SPIO|nr:CPBP family glutamic-type intramembrane protease [Entomospira nematocera]NIZ46617.1 CPBP family intramembrane metalloprotease [Entomospira nematocera]WDI33585.1 CPBP family glutamic-type intramembrane protease [Entomospira nematocera]
MIQVISPDLQQQAQKESTIDILLWNSFYILLAIILQPSIIKKILFIKIDFLAIIKILLSLLAINLLFSPFINIEPEASNLTSFRQMYHHSPVLLLFILIQGAYREEIFFRLLPMLTQPTPRIIHMIIWQFGFALLHIPSFRSMIVVIPIFLSGLVLWNGYTNNSTLHTVSIAHLLYNIIIIYILY